MADTFPAGTLIRDRDIPFLTGVVLEGDNPVKLGNPRHPLLAYRVEYRSGHEKGKTGVIGVDDAELAIV